MVARGGRTDARSGAAGAVVQPEEALPRIPFP